jgi:hypothetical protein
MALRGAVVFAVCGDWGGRREMTYEEWFKQELHNGLVDDLQGDRLMTKEAYRAGQEEMRKRSAAKIRADCIACGGSGYGSHPNDPDPTECEYCGRLLRSVANLPLEGDDD